MSIRLLTISLLCRIPASKMSHYYISPYEIHDNSQQSEEHDRAASRKADTTPMQFALGKEEAPANQIFGYKRLIFDLARKLR